MVNPTLPVETLSLPQRPPGNRRAAVRWQSAPATPGFVHLPNSPGGIIGWITDLSVSGVGLLLPQPLEPDSAVRLELEKPAQTGTLAVEARVVRMTRMRD